MKLSILITVLNDQIELTETIKSIRTTAGDAPEIVVVDDFSDVPVTVPPDCQLSRNPGRRGVGPSRHKAAEMATGEFILIIDSHNRFEPGWYEIALARIEAKPDVLYCCTCLGMEEGRMEILDQPVNCTAKDIKVGQGCQLDGTDIIKMDDKGKFYGKKRPNVRYLLRDSEKVSRKQTAVYAGATLVLTGQDSKGNKQVFEGKWASKPTDDVELPCLMGASYLMSRRVFFDIGGFNEMRMWGSSEPYLSLKAWLCGYEIRLLQPVRVGHKFRDRSPYSFEIWNTCYNKMRAILTLMNEDEAGFLICKLKEAYGPNDFQLAANQIALDMPAIQERQIFYRSKFGDRNLKWFCAKFGINYPLP